jgi:UPF0042 nucleotide-binding protein
MALKVKIFSFSYKISGIPEDNSGNGGGFVFDCRFIYNPGRLEEFGNLTGKDKEIIDFLDGKKSMQEFLENVIAIIKPAIENYLERDFTDLMISFGCTGGRHRSVYCAEKINKYINKTFPQVLTKLHHIELQ